MKTSNKLLFSFLGFAWLSMVGCMLASVHLLESKPFVKDAVVSSTPVDDDYSVVSIQDFGKLALVMSKDTRIERRKISFEGNDEHVSEDVDPYFVEVRDDTLFISNAEIKQYETWALHVDRQIKSLILNNVTEVNALNAFEYDSLKILASNSSFRLPRDHGLAFLAFKGEAGAHLSVDGIANLEIHLNQSKADITQFLGKVSGELIGAQVSLPKETTEVALKKDTNSKFYFWN